MELTLDDEQSAIRSTFEEFARRESDPAVVRRATATGFDAGLWTRLTDLGWTGAFVAEAQGGAGASLLSAALACHELGSRLAPVPFAETVAAARLLAAVDAGELLEQAMAGSVLVTLAPEPASGGVFRFVAAGACADVVVGMDGDELVAITSPPPGEPLPNLGRLPLQHRPVAGARCVREVLTSGAAAREALDHATAEWRVLLAAALVGLGTRSVRIAADYVKERHQFGRPIASFQTVQHGLADVAVSLEGSRLLVDEAAWAADEDRPRSAALSWMALGLASEHAATAASRALHFHGGYGFTTEYDVHLYVQRARGWALAAGQPRAAFAEAWRLLGEGNDALR